jgi:Protein of unknown function (DUF2516)
VSILGVYFSLMTLLGFALFILELVAFIDAAMRPTDAYVAAGKQTKQFWLVLIGLFSFITLTFGPLGLFGLGLVGIVASGVYLLDVRPALKEVGGGRGRGGNQHMGPYGPW